MAKFTDRLGREWDLSITVHEIKQVRKGLDINLFDAFAGDYSIYSAVVGDPEKLVAVAFVILQAQIAQRGLSEEEFGKGMAGDALAALGDAFTQALIDFFPNARGRDVVRATLSKARELLELRTQVLGEVIGALHAPSLLEAPSSGSTSVPASSASPPTPSPSTSSS